MMKNLKIPFLVLIIISKSSMLQSGPCAPLVKRIIKEQGFVEEPVKRTLANWSTLGIRTSTPTLWKKSNTLTSSLPISSTKTSRFDNNYSRKAIRTEIPKLPKIAAIESRIEKKIKQSERQKELLNKLNVIDNRIIDLNKKIKQFKAALHKNKIAQKIWNDMQQEYQSQKQSKKQSIALSIINKRIESIENSINNAKNKKNALENKLNYFKEWRDLTIENLNKNKTQQREIKISPYYKEEAKLK